MSRDSIDPFEEFQFKPLSEGLGFHRKEKSFNAASSEDNEDAFQLTPKQFKSHGLDLIEEEKSLDFKSPLPRPQTRTPNKEETLSPTSTAVDEILKNLGQKRNFDFENSKKTSQKVQTSTQTSLGLKTETQLHATRVSLAAGFLDSLLVTAGTLMGFIILLTVTQVDLLANLTHAEDSGIYIASFGVFFGVSVIYYLVTRMFLGSTAGEWAYDQQLGTAQDQKELSYGPLVIIRTCINLATGIVLLPLLSLIFNRDLVGQMMGLQLYRKN